MTHFVPDSEVYKTVMRAKRNKERCFKQVQQANGIRTHFETTTRNGGTTTMMATTATATALPHLDNNKQYNYS